MRELVLSGEYSYRKFAGKVMSELGLKKGGDFSLSFAFFGVINALRNGCMSMVYWVLDRIYAFLRGAGIIDRMRRSRLFYRIVYKILPY